MKIRLFAIVIVLVAGGCGPHGSPTARSFWGSEYEGKTKFASAEAELARIEIPTPVVTYALDNGLRVIQHADHRSPFVAVLVEYDVGAFDDPKGQPGLAHLTEHLLFRGSRNVQDGAFMRDLKGVGGADINATTKVETTVYMETVPANQLELALWMESDRLAFPFERLDAASFAAEKGVVKNELLDREDVAYSRIGEMILRAVYPPGHPYHDWPTVQDKVAVLDKLRLEDVRSFFRDHYGPNHATMVLVGDIENQHTKALVTKYFAALPSRSALVKTKVPLDIRVNQPTTLHIVANVPAPMLILAWPTISIYAPGDAELDVLSTLMASHVGQLGSIVTNQYKIATLFKAQQFSERFGGMFMLQMALKSSADFERALEASDAALERLRNNPPPVDLTTYARFPWMMKLLFRTESLYGKGFYFLSYLRSTRDPRYLSRDLARYAAVDRDSLQDAARFFLDKEHRVVAMVTPMAGAPIGGELEIQP